jgi:hypothetical protein
MTFSESGKISYGALNNFSSVQDKWYLRNSAPGMSEPLCGQGAQGARAPNNLFSAGRKDLRITYRPAISKNWIEKAGICPGYR